MAIEPCSVAIKPCSMAAKHVPWPRSMFYDHRTCPVAAVLPIAVVSARASIAAVFAPQLSFPVLSYRACFLIDGDVGVITNYAF